MTRRRLAAILFMLIACSPFLLGQNFSLISPNRAGVLSKHPADGFTRAVLYRTDFSRDKPLRALSRISGVDSDREVLDGIEVILSNAVSWRLGWDAADPRSSQRAQAYFSRAMAGLKAWFGTCVPGYRPLEESRLDGLHVAWDMVSARADPESSAAARRFFFAFASANLLPRTDYPAGTWTNCWQSYRVKRATLAAYALGDKNLIARAEAAFCRQISDNLAVDGSPIDFVEHDSLSFAVYDLQALAIAALAAMAHGRDWYHWKDSRGVSLEKALLWLSTAASTQSGREEFLHSSIPAERQAAENARTAGAPLRWSPVGARSLYWVAVRMDERWLPFAARLGADLDWLALAWPTAVAPVFAQSKPLNSSGSTIPARAGPPRAPPALSQAQINQAQLTQMLNTLKGGAGAAGPSAGASSSPAQTPLSLQDILMGSLGGLGGAPTSGPGIE